MLFRLGRMVMAPSAAHSWSRTCTNQTSVLLEVSIVIVDQSDVSIGTLHQSITAVSSPGGSWRPRSRSRSSRTSPPRPCGQSRPAASCTGSVNIIWSYPAGVMFVVVEFISTVYYLVLSSSTKRMTA